jgi:transcriptional regulator with XRE-family HTH domain
VIRIRFPAANGVRDRQIEPLWREAVGRELRRERHRADRTLADVAGRAGVSLQYLSEIERGLKEPSSEVLGAVAGALGLRLVDLTVRVSRTLHAASRPSGPLCLAA